MSEQDIKTFEVKHAGEDDIEIVTVLARDAIRAAACFIEEVDDGDLSDVCRVELRERGQTEWRQYVVAIDRTPRYAARVGM